MTLLLLLLACSADARTKRGDKALRAGELVEAEARYRKALDRDADHVGALYGLGWLYHLSGEPDRAREFFKRCLRASPEEVRCIRGLGSAAMAEGNPAQARTHYEQALALDPKDPRVLGSLGLLLLSQGDPQGALPYLEQAAELEPERGEHGYNLAEALFRMGEYQRALDTIDASLEKGSTEKRFQGLLLELRALVLVRMTSGRVDVQDCAGTTPAVLQWLDAADKDLDAAEATGAQLPNLPAARRQVHRRRSKVTEDCPQGQ
ncbi:MAG: tetratricopeptide repeat protein [Myxococcota bacterium]|nr:tetratricopeptide repeat protein [Myxococcota bacterium]